MTLEQIFIIVSQKRGTFSAEYLGIDAEIDSLAKAACYAHSTGRSTLDTLPRFEWLLSEHGFQYADGDDSLRIWTRRGNVAALQEGDSHA